MSNLIFSKVYGLTMALRKDDSGISKVLKKPLLQRKWHREPEFMDILENYLRPDDIFFDLFRNLSKLSSGNISKTRWPQRSPPSISSVIKKIETPAFFSPFANIQKLGSTPRYWGNIAP